MPTKTLVAEDAESRTFEVRDDGGAILHLVREAKLTAGEQNEQTLRDRAAQALAANATYLALANPSNAQVVQQVARLTRECSALIRIALSLLDTTDGT